MKDGAIEIQGDQRDTVARILTEAGFDAEQIDKLEALGVLTSSLRVTATQLLRVGTADFTAAFCTPTRCRRSSRRHRNAVRTTCRPSGPIPRSDRPTPSRPTGHALAIAPPCSTA